ncbi:MAG: YceD family protein [Gammaproteobacteria bacterium]|nr:YceD family protein [Gammaproteobacteria bacterium]
MRRRYQVQKEVTRNGYFEGEFAQSELHRLQEFLHPEDSAPSGRDVAVSFEFVRSEFDVPMIVGKLKTSLDLECQRCLGRLEMPMELEFQLMIDADDEMVRASSIDTLYSDDGFIDVFEVIEDELILAIPLVALHENIECNEYWRVAASAPETADRENPFAVLKQLKTTD